MSQTRPPRRVRSVILCVLAGLAGRAEARAQVNAEDSAPDNRYMALVNDEIITLRDLEKEWEYDRMFNSSLTERPPSSKYREIQRRLVQERLWIDHARRNEKILPLLTKKRIEDNAVVMFGDLWKDADEEMRGILARKSEENLCIFMVLRNDPRFVREVNTRPVELRAYYRENLEEFRSPERVHLGKVTLPRSIYGDQADVLGREIRALALQTGDLEAAARELAHGSYRDDGWREPGTSGLLEEILQFARTAAPGEFSGLIETRSSVFLYGLLAREEERLLPFQEAVVRIREKLRIEHRQQVLNFYFATEILPEAIFAPADLFEEDR